MKKYYSIKEIADLTGLSELMAQGNSTILEREKMLLEHQERIEKQIESLNNTLVQIKKKLERYQRIKEGIGEKDLELYEALSKKTNKSR